jgi:hypothetical protein
LPFLDIEFTRRGSTIDSKVYRKPTHSGSYTCYTSEHAHSHKMSVINSLAYRALKYCNNTEDQREELEFITRELKNNGYPVNEIRREFTKVRERIAAENEATVTQEELKTISIPFVEKLSYNISRILKARNIRTVMIPGNTIKNIVCTIKDKLIMEETPNCIYLIGCLDCEATYVGESKRRLKNRIVEHKAAVRNANGKDSALAEHAIDKLHTPDWDNLKIVSKSRDFKTRRFKEAVAILNQKMPLNRNEGMKISETFKPLITDFNNYSLEDNRNKFRAKTKTVRFLPNW